MKKYLIIETFPNTPHIETAVEIALKLKKKNNDIYFFWCGYDLSWKDWDLPWYKKILLFSFEDKILKIIEFLKKKNIKIIPRYHLNFKTLSQIRRKIKNHKNLNTFKYKKNFSAGEACLSSLISRYHDVDNSENFKRDIPKALESGCVIYQRSLKVIQDVNPDEIITFNSRFIISKPIIDAAKKLKKKILIHERASTPKKFFLFKGDIFNEKYYSQLIKAYWNANKSLSYSKKIKVAKKFFSLNIKKKFFKSMGLSFESKSLNKVNYDKQKKIITFFCTTDHEYASLPNKNDFFINPKWKNQFGAIKSLINIIRKDNNKFLFIKAHPNFSKNGMIDNKLRKFESSNVKYLANNYNIDSIDLMKQSDVVVTFGSSLELTAKYLNKKVISMFKHLYSPLKIFIYPKNEKSLKKMIYSHKIYKNKTNINLYKIAFFLMTFGEKYKYFKPIGFFRGNLIEKKINHFGPIVNFLVKLKILKY